MTELDAIVEEQALLLMWNGYTEKLLHNGEAQGSYKEHLKSAIQDILDRDETLVGKETIQLRLFGNFNAQEDKVLFTFSYEFDPLLSLVTLKEIEARLNDVPLVIPIAKGSDIWMAEDLYHRVKQLSLPVKNALEAQRRSHLSDIIHNEFLVLQANGYTGSKLELCLTKAIKKAESISDKEHHIIIKGKQNFKGFPDILQYRLHYYYHPRHTNLYLKSINAHLNNISRTFIGTREYPIPPAQDIYNYLLQERKTFQAKKIIGENPSSFYTRNRKV